MLKLFLFSGISEIKASVQPASGSDVTVSCLATGKPTPILQWKSTEKDQNLHLSWSSNTRVNSDGSNTTTSYLKLPSQFHGKSVECVAQSDNVEKSYQISLSGKNDEGKYLTWTRLETSIVIWEGAWTGPLLRSPNELCLTSIFFFLTVTNNTSRSYFTTVLVLIFMLIIIFVITLICLYKRLHGKQQILQFHLNSLC